MPATLAPPAPAEAPHSSGSLKTLGWVSTATGVVVAGVGLYVYANGRGKIDDAHCPNQICVRGIGDKDLHDSGRAGEKVGGGLAIAGSLIAVTGVVLLLSAPSEADTSESFSRWQLNWAGSGVDLQAHF